MNPLCIIDMGGHLGKGASAMARLPSPTARRSIGGSAPPINERAAQPGSEGGKNSHQLWNISTTGLPAQHRCTPMPPMPMPGQGAARKERAEQLRLFALDGAWAEPYVARANSKAAKAVGSGGRRWL